MREGGGIGVGSTLRRRRVLVTSIDGEDCN